MSLDTARWRLFSGISAIKQGEIIAYPTESVYGLGCRPDSEKAIKQLLLIKKRPLTKGLILLASHFDQLRPYLKPLSDSLAQQVFATWPGPVTWLLPAKESVPYRLRGEHTTLAVRVTAHPIASALCQAIGMPLISTSANRSGHPPARNTLQVRRWLGREIAVVVPGATGGAVRPTEIRDGLTGKVVRAG